MPGTLRAAGLWVRLGGRQRPVFEDLQFELRPGEVVGVLGRSGSGKSVLVQTLAGLLPWARDGAVRGAVTLGGESLADLDPAQRAHHLATCLDRQEGQLFLPSVDSEWGTALRQHRPQPGFAALVAAALGIDHLASRSIVELSSGERQRVALARTLVAAPRPVLLDEPSTHLDDSGLEGLRSALCAVREIGGSVLLTEHAGWLLAGAVDRWLELRDGQLVPAPPPLEPAVAGPPPAPAPQTVLHLEQPQLQRGGRRLLEGGELRLLAGEIVHIGGPNGAGKSSLARALAGHAFSAGVRFDPGPAARWRPREVALLLPSPDLQLFAPTAVEEVRLAGLGPLEAGEALARFGLVALAGRSPWTLSGGERQRLLLAAIEPGPAGVLILDEPAQGLDGDGLAELVRLLHRRAAEGGAVLVLSHRAELARAAHRRMRLDAGRLEAGA
ncbi:MAG TPA: ABC transporter ATP-binding protein [Thermoanaerobaculaceae bacterium]|nr:ABC transporter ATP-binding protein [Thermoanaerobaculaceae bacterium]HRS16759.1 ABC transporter ATP-binding protein [Thermoanaerobaculaceae bacterium]